MTRMMAKTMMTTSTNDPDKDEHEHMTERTANDMVALAACFFLCFCRSGESRLIIPTSGP